MSSPENKENKKNSQDEHFAQGDGSSKSTRVQPQIAAMEKGPGPAIYQLPQAVGYDRHNPTKYRNPSYSMGGRWGKLNDECSPGPKYGLNEALTRKGIQRTKSYTMSARNRPQRNLMSDVPGPGSASPKVDFASQYHKAPTWVMGERSSFKLGDNNPAPNSYGLPELIGSGVPNKCSSASYSLHARSKVGAPDEDLSKTPGPAAYTTTDNNVVYSKNPVWSLRSRSKSMTNVMATNPAPNAYQYRGFPDKKASAKFSMGIKHSEYVMPLIIDALD